MVESVNWEYAEVCVLCEKEREGWLAGMEAEGRWPGERLLGAF